MLHFVASWFRNAASFVATQTQNCESYLFSSSKTFFSESINVLVFFVFLNIDSGFWSVTTPHLPVDLIDNSLCLSGEHQHLFLPWFEQHPDYFETIQNIISNQTQWDAPRQSGSRLACWSVEPWVSRAPAPTLRLLLLLLVNNPPWWRHKGCHQRDAGALGARPVSVHPRTQHQRSRGSTLSWSEKSDKIKEENKTWVSLIRATDIPACWTDW